ncbi:Hsp20/alpha crystallin family protein [Thermosynechococcaceae cyanobacterium BACA0444]|uniref:Hsp20/alpha crystallin family protein n=1 Tax=Pseudocalidococcus azoricus BACA0444 TaxID=2918990 RepID=A0AAE4JW16_9CYAN|nr:Hsp20/alpha crystallin family protein [Pseudocalidococcus azoricus]MDS3860910.1 Hsp20/alpha crystallin family protein [Pseudocalidococcus azoricus BACA0444]
MALVRWQPFREIDEMQRELNRIFDSLSSSQTDGVGLAFSPKAELTETPEAYELRLELPGIKSEDLDIQATASAISISGERKSETKVEEGGMTRTEFHYGKFQRVIPLPGRVDHQNVAADYKDGILRLTLPKAEEEKNKVIRVSLPQSQ